LFVFLAFYKEYILFGKKSNNCQFSN